MQQYTELWLGKNRAIKLYEFLLREVSEEYGLSLVEADIISFLQHNPGLDTAADIAEFKMLTKGCVSKAVDSLMNKQLLTRRKDEKDRRKMHLYLTDSAKPVTEQIEKIHEELRVVMFDGFTEEELRMYASFRKRFLENVKNEMDRRRIHD